MLSLRQLLDLWGFTSHPFEAYTAENEPRLSEYFVAPPYFDDMVGSASSMTPAVVFGSRGIGKSAIRIHIENICARNNSEQEIGGKALAITYDDFTKAVEAGIDKISVDRHLETILNKAVTAALTVIADTLGEQQISEETIRDQFPQLDIEVLSRLVQRYFASLTELQRERAFKGIYNYFHGEALSFVDRINWFHRLWSTLRVPLIDIANIVQAVRGKEGIKPVDLSAPSKPTVPNTEALINDLHAVAAITQQLGFDGWYVLIDKVDEDEHTDSDASKSAKLIAPLVKNLRILEIPRIGFKFFLWNQLRPILVEERVRLDKIRNWEMSWTREELREMIDRRLTAYSDNRVRDLLSITDNNMDDIYDLVIDHAMSSPREIIHILDAIFREHARHSTQETGVLISRESVERGIDDYCSRRVRDLYPGEIIRAITRLPSARFTSADVQSVLKISKQSASVRINKWVDDGYIERTEDSRSGKDPSKAIYQYKVKEKRLERLIQRGISDDDGE